MFKCFRTVVFPVKVVKETFERVDGVIAAILVIGSYRNSVQRNAWFLAYSNSDLPLCSAVLLDVTVQCARTLAIGNVTVPDRV
jgi:hypothetical protein